jgi:hypothetical protein
MNTGGRQRSTNEREPEHQDIYVDREKKIDFTLFGFNFTTLDSSTKNILGMILIGLIFSVVIYGLTYIRKLRQKDVKKKKKKNE